MSVNDASTIVIDVSKMMLQIVTSITDNSRGIIYDCKIFIVQATGPKFYSIDQNVSKFHVLEQGILRGSMTVHLTSCLTGLESAV